MSGSSRYKATVPIEDFAAAHSLIKLWGGKKIEKSTATDDSTGHFYFDATVQDLVIIRNLYFIRSCEEYKAPPPVSA